MTQPPEPTARDLIFRLLAASLSNPDVYEQELLAARSTPLDTAAVIDWLLVTLVGLLRILQLADIDTLELLHGLDEVIALAEQKQQLEQLA